MTAAASKSVHDIDKSSSSVCPIAARDWRLTVDTVPTSNPAPTKSVSDWNSFSSINTDPKSMAAKTAQPLVKVWETQDMAQRGAQRPNFPLAPAKPQWESVPAGSRLPGQVPGTDSLGSFMAPLAANSAPGPRREAFNATPPIQRPFQNQNQGASSPPMQLPGYAPASGNEGAAMPLLVAGAGARGSPAMAGNFPYSKSLVPDLPGAARAPGAAAAAACGSPVTPLVTTLSGISMDSEYSASLSSGWSTDSRQSAASAPGGRAAVPAVTPLREQLLRASSGQSVQPASLAAQVVPIVTAAPEKSNQHRPDFPGGTVEEIPDVPCTCVNFEEAEAMCKTMDTARVPLVGVFIIPLSHSSVSKLPIQIAAANGAAPEMAAFALEFENSSAPVVPGEASLVSLFPDAAFRLRQKQAPSPQRPVARAASPARASEEEVRQRQEEERAEKEMQEFLQRRQKQLEARMLALGGMRRERMANNGSGKEKGAFKGNGDDMTAYVLG